MESCKLVVMKSVIGFAFLMLLAGSALAQPYGLEGHMPVLDDRAAGCAPANSTAFLEYNNVRALIHSG
jgi:hypothetical protein